ncbi:MAG: hypothetical protein Q9174_005431 [Haloplaca sp. 1 TL-2023]
MSAAANRMAAKVAESASKAAREASKKGSLPTEGQKKGKETVLQKGAKKDPELYVCHAGLHYSRIRFDHTSSQILLTIMSGAFGLAGYHFARKPTSSSSEAPISMAEGTMPWQTASADGDKGGSEHFKYQYHPGGDRSKAPKNAPSALHSVIIPNVTLKKSEHDQFNKWGKEGF